MQGQKQRQKRVLVYNGFPFHYEMFGFILDFCKKFNIEPTIINKVHNEGWLQLYKAKYQFHYNTELSEDIESFSYVILLTDDDFHWPESLVTQNIICIDHWYKCRRHSIQNHIPITQFQKENPFYALPVFEYIPYAAKMQVLQEQKRPIITLLGSSSLPLSNDFLSIITNFRDFDIYIINHFINRDREYLKLPNVYAFENIDATHMFHLLFQSTYVYFYPAGHMKSYQQLCNYVITAAMPLSFTTGCKFILPRQMNETLQLSSVITYEFIPNSLTLSRKPSLEDTFDERERLIHTRNNTLLKTMYDIDSKSLQSNPSTHQA